MENVASACVIGKCRLIEEKETNSKEKSSS
jgi:hypothetical protein